MTAAGSAAAAVRTTARCVRRAAHAPVWALLFDDEVVDDLPRDVWDVPVDGVITPSGGAAPLRNTGGPSPG